MEDEKKDVTDIKKIEDQAEVQPLGAVADEPAEEEAVDSARAEMEAQVARAKELLDAATATCKELQDEFPMISFVFAASPMPGQMLTSRGGSDVIQLGMLQVLSAMTSIPMVHKMMVENQPRVVNPNSPSVIPLRPNARS